MIRARFYSLSLWICIASATAAILGAQFSGRQPATVALDVGLSVIRVTLPVLALALIHELFSREFDRKLYLNSLTYPRSRHQFMVSRIITIQILLTGSLISLAAMLALLILGIGETYNQATPPSLGTPYLVTFTFVALDQLVVLAIGTLIAIIANTSSFVTICTLGFLLVARSYSSVILLIEHDNTLVGNSQTYQATLSLLGYLLPDLGAIDVRMIALYDRMDFLPADWLLRVSSTLAYSIALFALAAWALNRKRFS